MRPWWWPLRTGGEYNDALRRTLLNESGVYAVREVGGTRPLYVGMSDAGVEPKGEKRYPERFWKTILRHLQAPGSFRYAGASGRSVQGPHGQQTEWVYTGGGDLQVAIWIAPPGETYTLETRLIGKLEPLYAKQLGPKDTDPGAVPF